MNLSGLSMSHGYSGTKGYSRAVRLVTALDGASLSVEKNKILGIIGESGSGKTTLAKLILGLLKPTSGIISFSDLTDKSGEKRKPAVQVIFQDPYDSLSHVMTIKEIVAEPYIIKHKSQCDVDVICKACSNP